MSSHQLREHLIDGPRNSRFGNRKFFHSFMSDGIDRQEPAAINISCSTILCCCCSKEKYHEARKATWQTLSLHASKFGNRARCCSASQIFEYCSIVLILSQVVYASIWVTYGDQKWVYHPGVTVYNVVCTVLFTCEYLLRVWSSVEDTRQHRLQCQCCNRTCGRRGRWLVKPMSLFDLFCLAIFFVTCGFYALGQSVQSWVINVRFLLVLRLERQFKAIERIKTVLGTKAEELTTAVFFTAVCVLLPSVLMYYIENVWFKQADGNEQLETLWLCLWWAVCTITSVGYGDAVPQTMEGKVLAALTSLMGVATFAILTGIIGATFVEVMAEEAEQRHQKEERHRLSMQRKHNLSSVMEQLPFRPTPDRGQHWTPGGGDYFKPSRLESQSTMLGPQMQEPSELSASARSSFSTLNDARNNPGGHPQVCCPYCRRQFSLHINSLPLRPPSLPNTSTTRPNSIVRPNTATISEGHESNEGRSEHDSASASVVSADQSEKGWV